LNPTLVGNWFISNHSLGRIKVCQCEVKQSASHLRWSRSRVQIGHARRQFLKASPVVVTQWDLLTAISVS